MPKWSWLDMLIGSEKTAISTICIGLSYKSIFVLCSSPPSLCVWGGDNKTNVEQEPKPKNRPIVDICTEFLDEIQKLVASQTAKVDAELKSELVDEPELEPEVVDEPDPESEVKDLIKTHVILPAEPTMKRLSSVGPKAHRSSFDDD